MKKFRAIFVTLISFIALLGSPVVFAQVDAMLTQHWSMPTLLNPAATGDIDYIRIRGGARLESLGIYHAPKNFVGTADSPFKVFGKRIGAGIFFRSESYDLYRNLNIGAQGSYKLNILKGTFSVGFQLGYYNTKFKGSELNLAGLGGVTGDGGSGENVSPQDEEDTGSDSNDGSDNGLDLPTHDVKAGTFDLGVGVRYEHPKFHIAISALHLTNTTLKLTSDGETGTETRYIEQKLPATLYFDGGGNIAINNSLFTLQPSILLGTDFKDFVSVIEMRATYNRLVTFGVDYRYNSAVGVLAGLSIKNFFIGYSWEYDYTSSAKKSTGNHEVVLGYQFKLDLGGKNPFSHRSIRIM